jgi:phytoene synthase
MRDRDLVRLYWPVELRPAFDALFGIDDAMAEVVVRSTEPALAAIKLAWWREALERLDVSPPPPEPRLQAVVAHLLPHEISGKDLGEIEPGWATLLDEWPDSALIAKRGAILFQLGARLLRISDAGLSDAGALYAQIDVARRGISDSRSLASELGGLRFPRRARPLSALAALAARDLRQPGHGWEPEATPGRAAALLWHRLTGKVA